MSTSHSDPTQSDQEVVCAACKTPNRTSRRFCGRCGQRLWEPCPECLTPCATDLAYCGSCGVSLEQSFQQRLTALQDRLARSDDLRREGRYFEAIALVRGVNDHGDTRLADLLQQMTDRAAELTAEKNELLKKSTVTVRRAKELASTHEYQSATRELESIPPGIRSREAITLLEEMTSKQAEVESLKQFVRQALDARNWDGLLPKVSRLVELRPLDTKVKKLHEQLLERQSQEASATAEQRLAAAKRVFLEGDYLRAGEILGTIEESTIQSAHRRLYDTVREVDWCVRFLRQEPFLSNAPHVVAQRWTKLRPEDAQAKRMVQESQRRLRAAASTSTTPSRWAKAVDQSALGPPIELWQAPKRLEAAPELDVWNANRQRFAVALGLAIQGLGLAHVRTNLMPQSSGGLLSGLPRFGKSASPTEAWGIDLGATGVKALRLKHDKSSDRIEIDDVTFVPHDDSLADTKDDESARAIMRQTLESFVEQCEPNHAAAVVSFSGPRSLSRVFEMPKLKGKKVADAIAYEAKMQIPIPVDEIYYDWHLWPDSDNKHFRDVTLLAARRAHIQQPLDLCHGLPLQVVGVQSVCVALYNVVAFDQQFHRRSDETESDSPSPDDSEPAELAVLDLGAESSTLVTVSPNRMRFRSLALGTHRLDRSLMTRFRLTRPQSRVLRHKPHAAKWLYQVDEQLQQTYEELIRDLSRTLHAYEADGVRVSRILLSGGGTKTLGLSRLLIHHGG